MRFFIARACAACVVLYAVLACISTARSAEAVEPQGELTLAQAIEAALQRNPDLKASSYELLAAQARTIQAGLRPNPEVALDLENFAGSGEARGTDELETTLSLSQVIELGGKRALRRLAADADLDVVTIEQRARELDVLGEIDRRFIDVVAAQERVRFAQEAAQLSQRTLDAISARVLAARSPEAERSRARIALTRAMIEQRQAESELRAARYALGALWGSSTPAFTVARADLFTFNPVASFESLVARIERNPDFVRFASEARLRDAELRLAQAQARPNLSLGLGVRRLNATNDMALVGGFSVALPVFDRNQGAIREARVRRAQTDVERQAAFTRARASLYGVYQELQAAQVRTQTLRGEAVPQAQLALEQTQSGYDRGRFSFLELVTAQQELLELQAAAIDAAATYHRSLAELERLTSEPLANPPIEAPLP